MKSNYSTTQSSNIPSICAKQSCLGDLYKYILAVMLRGQYFSEFGTFGVWNSFWKLRDFPEKF